MESPLEEKDEALLPDFPKGPLQTYRARASFSWKELLLFLEGEDIIRLKRTIFSTLENDPLFARCCRGDIAVDKYRELSFLRCKRFLEYRFVRVKDFLQAPVKVSVLIECMGMYDWSVGIKYILNMLVFTLTVFSLGSERHFEYIQKIFKMEIFGCFALTELSHGSNSKAIRTTAHYDPSSEEFIINSPDFEASKFWVGNMGKTATHAVVFAQLYMPGGQCHGLHAFVVQIRDPKTLLSMPGVMVGDIGRKLGQNGLDNGFAMFHHVRVPRQALLNRTGDVTPDGSYVTPFKDNRQRFGASLDSLSAGRVSIMSMSTVNLKLAVCIAIRFSATRRQFGPTNMEEIPVLEYQMQQWRLLPYLAAVFALSHFSKCLFINLLEFYQGMQSQGRSAQQAALGREIHALASAGKPLTSWTAQRGVQECREACGGHGYLAVNRLGDLRDDNDPNCTYEGDNNVLLQQTSNFLLSLLAEKAQGGARAESPLKITGFLDAYPDILSQKFSAPSAGNAWAPEEVLDHSYTLAAYRWLVCYLLRESDRKLNQEKQAGSSDFDARNNSQVYHCHSLALAFMELTVAQRFHDFTRHASVPPSLRDVLGRLSALYSVWSLSQHVATLYQGGYFSGEQAGKMVKATILDLCSQLKDDAVALVDVLAPSDFFLDSPIGKADGQLYQNLWAAVLQGNQVLERPSWWPKFSCEKLEFRSLKPKLAQLCPISPYLREVDPTWPK
ncbi:PREDICTED: peroxisomal acyl-coenzyme A oxidase 3 [Chrysochloris asiatica]|uniref:Acyl-coenzyme A oxidase n=1 Tax=Chrysochloris asiatica TaxID=185453 RepID=A0A9B0WZ28_CHRAS|nr:PREDICTED: peroxisomal acyl-coenzyme A oxidase 3 [Chrysochloris asiatica]